MATPSGERSGFRLERWQTLLAGALAAVAGIVAAVIAASGTSDEGPGTPTQTSGATSPAYGVSIRDVIYREGPDAAFFNVHGIASGVSAWDDIYVLARPEEESPAGDAAASAGQDPAWLVSNRADRSEDGTWETDLTVPRGTPTPLRFVAVIYTGEACPPPQRCSIDDPRSLLAEQGPEAFAPSFGVTAP